MLSGELTDLVVVTDLRNCNGDGVEHKGCAHSEEFLILEVLLACTHVVRKHVGELRKCVQKELYVKETF